MLTIKNPRRLCHMLRERYATGAPLADEERHDLTIIRQILTIIDRLLVQRAPQITSPWDAVNALVPEMSALDQEEVRILLLSTRRHVICTITLYRGTLNSTEMRVAEVFRPAIIASADSILMIHNHPSGDPTPSPEDKSFTYRMRSAAAQLDIEVVDHIVVAGGRFLSLKERGFFDGSYALPEGGGD